MTCLCIDDLRPASFRGASFFVAEDKGDYGRRGPVHEYPMRDDPYFEDLGEKKRTFNVNGYLAGDNWIAQKDALVAACTARGPAILQLPTEQAQLVACLHLSVSRTKDACGFYSVQMEFVVAKNFGIAPIAVAMIESLIGSVFASAIEPMTQMFANNYVGSNVQQYALDLQVERVQSFAATAINVIETYPSQSPERAAEIVQAATAIYQAADATTPEIVTSVANVVNVIGTSMTPEHAEQAMTVLANFSVNETTLSQMQARRTQHGDTTLSSTPIGPTDLADIANAAMFNGMVRSFAMMKLAQAISAKNFRDRAEAIQARANVVELFNMQIAEFDEDAVVNLLLEARNLAVRSISQKMASIVPVIQITASTTRPSFYWSARLYETVDRADELSDRNGVNNPAFMPSIFEALSR